MLEKIPEEDRIGVLKFQGKLGQTWNPESYQLLFAKPKLSHEKENILQRKLLSMAASLFDPIGIILPFAIRLRCISQKVIKQGHNWHQLLSRKFTTKFSNERKTSNICLQFNSPDVQFPTSAELTSCTPSQTLHFQQYQQWCT